MKKYLGVLSFGAVEFFSYFALDVQNLDSFFTIWAFISIMLALYIFIGPSKGLHGGYGLGSSTTSASFLENIFAMKMGESVGNRSKKVRKVVTTLFPYIVLIIYCLINIAGLIINLKINY